eukprot:9005027-Prorocentrum_lima.AAC.1
MPDGQTGMDLLDPNDTTSQGNDFEAARGATTRFNPNDLPEAQVHRSAHVANNRCVDSASWQ